MGSECQVVVQTGGSCLVTDTPQTDRQTDCSWVLFDPRVLSEETSRQLLFSLPSDRKSKGSVLSWSTQW